MVKSNFNPKKGKQVPKTFKPKKSPVPEHYTFARRKK